MERFLLLLERKILVGIDVYFDLLDHRFLRKLVHRVAVHVDGFVRLRGAGMLAAAAADAVVRLHFRDLEPLVYRIRIGHHVHRFRWAMLRTRAAIRVIRIDHAVLFDELRDAELREFFLFNRKRQNGAGRANVHADRAVVVAVARVEVQPRLHHSE